MRIAKAAGMAIVAVLLAAGCGGAATTSPSPVTPTAAATATAAATSAECARAASPRSPASTQATTITFANARSSSIKVFWSDFNGARVPYLTVAPQQSAVQPTFVGHVWIVTDEQDSCVEVRAATAAALTVTVGP